MSSKTLAARAAVAGCVLAAIVVATSLVVVMQAVKASMTYEALVTCPIDGQQFKASMIGSYQQWGVRLDTKPLSSSVVPFPYPVCPGNGFVIYQDTFSETELGAIKLIVSTDDYQRLRRENTDYYMIAYVKERTGGHDYDLGNMYLRASWEAERDRPYLVDRYRALAIERFDGFAKRELNRSKEWWTASILAAELDRLLGHFDTVEVRFNGLPLAELSARFADTGLVDVVDQIRMHALRHNSNPEEMRFLAVGGGTVGLKETPMAK
jgi:hypothetical protein